MQAYIQSISYILPEKILTNEELNKLFPEWNIDKISSKIGIEKRHILSKEQTAMDIAIEAVEKLFLEHKIDKSKIDFILYCTQSPDYLLPTTACIIQHKLGLSTKCGALDFNLGCSGYIYGLSLAKGLIAANIAQNILLITAESYSKYIHPKDKGNRSIFGDAASASIISTEGFAEILNFDLGTDGQGANNLIVKTGASRYPNKAEDIRLDDNGNPISSDHLFMNGPEVFLFTLERVPSLIDNILIKNKLNKEDINLFILHQANVYILNNLRKKIKIDEQKLYICVKEFGNTVSSTIPIALYEAKKNNLLKGNILLAGFGVGYSWGGVIIKCQ